MPILWKVGVAGLALMVCPAAAGAQRATWAQVIAEADSVGPEQGRFAPSRGVECGRGVQPGDSVQVSIGPGEYWLTSRSMRTRGMFSSVEIPRAGSQRFSLRRVICDEKSGRPLTFVIEKDHRYFYLVFNLREHPTYAGLSFLSGSGEWVCRRWDPDQLAFDYADCRPLAGSKC